MEDVDPGGGDDVGVKGVKEGGFVDKFAAGGVDEDGGFFDELEFVGAEDLFFT